MALISAPTGPPLLCPDHSSNTAAGPPKVALQPFTLSAMALITAPIRLYGTPGPQILMASSSEFLVTSHSFLASGATSPVGCGQVWEACGSV